MNADLANLQHERGCRVFVSPAGLFFTDKVCKPPGENNPWSNGSALITAAAPATLGHIDKAAALRSRYRIRTCR
jgi:hypothetical protein